MKNRIHIILWLIVVVFILLTYAVFYNTLALFETDSSGTINTDIGKWVIKVNNQTITDGQNESININNFVYEQNSHVEQGYIAPGTSAYFDLVIDASDCDVAVLYNLDLNFDETTYADNISFSVETLNGPQVVRTDEYVYSGIVSLNSIINGETTSFRIHITWDDDPTYDEDDTALGLVEGNHLVIPMKFNAKQYLGETLVEYTG